MLREMEKITEILEEQEQCPLEEVELSEIGLEHVRNIDLEVNTNELVVFWLKSIVFVVLGVIIRK